jgi:hypothetical protein
MSNVYQGDLGRVVNLHRCATWTFGNSCSCVYHSILGNALPECWDTFCAGTQTLLRIALTVGAAFDNLGVCNPPGVPSETRCVTRRTDSPT